MHRIRHQKHVFNSPVSEEKVAEAIKLLDLPRGAKVLDIGCGIGEELLRTAMVYEIDGVGVDLDSDALEFAEELKSKYGPKLKGSVSFVCQKWQDYHDGDATLDAVFCIGSTQAFGDVNEAFHTCLRSVKSMLKPGGKLLLGDLYWRKLPSKEYLKMLHCESSSYGVWQDDVDSARDAGYHVIKAWESSKEEFDVFEKALWDAARQLAEENPEDTDRQAKWRGIQKWQKMYEAEGRDTLGFGLYLLQKPAKAA